MFRRTYSLAGSPWLSGVVYLPSAPCPSFGPALLDDATPFWKAHPQAGIRTALVRRRPDSSKPPWVGPSREFFRSSRRTRRCPTTHVSTALPNLGDIAETPRERASLFFPVSDRHLSLWPVCVCV